MNTLKKNVYYCEYCNKHGLSASHISQHEKHCTSNSNRECRLCQTSDMDFLKKAVEDIKSRYIIHEAEKDGFNFITVEWTGKKVTLDEISEITNDCPACMLSIIRLSGLSSGWHDINYDYKNHIKEYWKDRNDRERELDERSSY